MYITRHVFSPVVRTLAVALIAIAGAACGIDKQSAPSLIGPSEFALSVAITASPDQLPRDGSSQSVVTVLVRDEKSQPVAGQRLGIGTNVGTVSQREVVTDSTGRATFSFTAPPANLPVAGNVAIVQLTPIGGNFDNAVTRSFSIALTGVTNTTAPSPSFTVNPAAPNLLDGVVLDASATTDEGVLCNDNCTYAWDLGGEATMTGRVINYRFRAVRTYAVKLTVTDSTGTSANLTQNVVVGQGNAPTATFSFAPTSPGQFETVNFTAEASRVGVTGRTIASYSWNFGDGATASGVTTSHAYNVLGAYTVTLTVTDSAGIQGTSSQLVTVVAGVTADFTYSPRTPKTGCEVFFDPEASRGSTGFGGRNPIVDYIWNFGDATTTSTQGYRIVSHTYTAPTGNTFRVVLTVVDSAGRRATTNQDVAVAVNTLGTCP